MEDGKPQGRTRTRERLGHLLREGGEVLTVANAARILELSRPDASKVLSRWSGQGWLNRIKRGIYIPVPVEAPGTEGAVEDAWALVPELFGQAYVGGWSAAEHWDLTEQIFSDTCVFTVKPVARRLQVVHGIRFAVTHIAGNHLFGTRAVWRGRRKINISDPARTVIDMLSCPWTGGGLSHVMECLQCHFLSPDFDPVKLVEYGERLANAAVFKRLGFLAERFLGPGHELAVSCRSRLSKGRAQLDPSLKGDRLVTRWRLFIPRGMENPSGIRP